MSTTETMSENLKKYGERLEAERFPIEALTEPGEPEAGRAGQRPTSPAAAAPRGRGVHS